MQFELYWEKEHPKSFHRGLTPTLNSSSFYTSDSLLTSFPSTYLREICLETGDELNKVYLRSEVASLCIDSLNNKLFVPSTRSLYQIDKNSFTIDKKFKSPPLCQYVTSAANNVLLMMNHRASTLNIVDPETEMIKKKRLKSGVENACCAILQETADTFLICSPYSGIIYRYSIEKETLSSTFTDDHFCNVRLSKTGNIYIQSAVWIENKVRKVGGLPIVKCYSSFSDKDPDIFDIGEQYGSDLENMVISEDERIIYLFNQHNLIAFSKDENKVLNEKTSWGNELILNVFPEKKMVLTTNKITLQDKQQKHILKCWRIKS